MKISLSTFAVLIATAVVLCGQYTSVLATPSSGDVELDSSNFLNPLSTNEEIIGFNKKGAIRKRNGGVEVGGAPKKAHGSAVDRSNNGDDDIAIGGAVGAKISKADLENIKIHNRGDDGMAGAKGEMHILPIYEDEINNVEGAKEIKVDGSRVDLDGGKDRKNAPEGQHRPAPQEGQRKSNAHRVKNANTNDDPLDIAAGALLHGSSKDDHLEINNLRHSGVPLTEEQKKFLKEHEGHESQHALMSLILFGSLILSQVLVMVWKKYHAKSYNLFTLAGFWVIPGLLGMYAGHTRFVVIWVIFSILNLLVIRKAMEKPIGPNAPRLVYGWYTWIHRITSGVALFGGACLVISFFHIGIAFNIISIETDRAFADWALIVTFYGVYFGTLGRDCVERLAERMATTLGYYSKGGIPEKYLRHGTCAICGLSTTDGTGSYTAGSPVNFNSEERSKLFASDLDSTGAAKSSGTGLLRLGCGHVYHSFCIRGWTIIGKKDTCPYCGERVDMTQFKKNPWDVTQMLYLQFLDWVKFILVWNPLVFVFVHFVFKVFHLQ